MKRSIMALIILTCSVATCYSQTHVSGIINSGVTKPRSDFFNYGFALNGTILFGVSDHFDVTARTGYISWNTKKEGPASLYAEDRISVYPLYLGVRYYALKGTVSPYIGTEVGVNIISYGEHSTLVKKLGYDLSLGINYALNKSLQLDIGTAFNTIRNSEPSRPFGPDSNAANFFTPIHVGLIFSL